MPALFGSKGQRGSTVLFLWLQHWENRSIIIDGTRHKLQEYYLTLVQPLQHLSTARMMNPSANEMAGRLSVALGLLSSYLQPVRKQLPSLQADGF